MSSSFELEDRSRWNPSEEGTRWVLTPQAFEKLLLFLDGDRDVAAEKYELLYKKLTKVFEWRNHPEPEKLADETMNRVARKLMEGVEVRSPNPASFVLGVGRMVYLEAMRKLDREHQAIRQSTVSLPAEEDEDRDRMLRCLDRCLESIAQAKELLIRYYTETGGEKIKIRKRLADELGVTAGVLRLRAHRLRAKVEACVSNCSGA